MTVFVPCFSTQWEVKEVNLEDARYWKHYGYDSTLLYKGMLYNGEHVFSDARHAWLWIYREPEEYTGRVDLFDLPSKYFYEKRIFG